MSGPEPEPGARLEIGNPFLEWLGVRLVDWSPGYAAMHLDVCRRSPTVPVASRAA